MTGPPPGPVIEVLDVHKRFGTKVALDGASFSIGRGVTGMLGANGAGKTTMLGLVLGLHRPDSGSIQVLGRDAWRAGPEIRARVGYAPEHDALPPDVAAFDVVRHLAELHGLPRREATGRASDVLHEVGLGEEAFRPVGTMSTGQRQRVKLAQAIAHDPALVLLDEPTNGLDPAQREQMLALVDRVGHDLGIDVVLSSHLLEEVERVSDAVVILEDGHTSASGRLADLRSEQGELLVDVEGAAPQLDGFEAAVRAAGLAVARDRTRFGIGLRDEHDYDVVRDALVACDLAVQRLRRRAATLEDVFLKTT